MELMLGLHGLPNAEVSLVKTIVRLSSTLSAAWSTTETIACDLLLTGEPARQLAVAAGTTIVPILQRDDGADGLALKRPIRAEQLIRLLNDEAARRGEAMPTALTEACPNPAARAPGATARLQRWPSWALLNGRPAHVRMATLLSKASLSTASLSSLSGFSHADCEAFLRLLDQQGLLAWTAPAAVPIAPVAVPDARRGLLQSLRRRLGIAA